MASCSDVATIIAAGRFRYAPREKPLRIHETVDYITLRYGGSHLGNCLFNIFSPPYIYLLTTMMRDNYVCLLSLLG